MADKGGQWADAPQRSNNSLYASFDPTSEIGFAQKVDILKQIDAYLRTVTRVNISVILEYNGRRESGSTG